MIIRRPITCFARSFATSSTLRSHVGSSPIPYPPSVKFSPTPAGHLTISGPKGTKSLPIPPFVQFSHGPIVAPSTTNPPPPDAVSEMTVSVSDPTLKIQRATWGLSRALIANAVHGLTVGFSTSLKLVGVGFRAAVEPDPLVPTTQRLNMKLNYAHNVYVPIPEGIVATTPLPTRIVLRGTDKQALGQFAARIRSWRKPEPYKGKVRSTGQAFFSRSDQLMRIPPSLGYICWRRENTPKRCKKEVDLRLTSLFIVSLQNIALPGHGSVPFK